MRTDGRTDVHNKTNSLLRDFANAPINLFYFLLWKYRKCSKPQFYLNGATDDSPNRFLTNMKCKIQERRLD
jgi:hypothetical protein